MPVDGVRWVTIGRLLAPFGVRGEIRVRPLTEDPGTLLGHTRWRLRPPRESAPPPAPRATSAPYDPTPAVGGAAPQGGGDDPDGITPSGWRVTTLLSGRRHGQGLVVRLQGVDSPEAAQALNGWWVELPRDALPEPDEQEFYWTDLIGCRVQDEDGAFLGEVSEMMATGANDVLVVRTPAGEERLFPFTHEVVPEVDVDARLIVVRPLPGM